MRQGLYFSIILDCDKRQGALMTGPFLSVWLSAGQGEKNSSIL
jgi:hypothetical protein